MKIKSFKIENFRNYETLELELSEGTNIFCGENAQGKTNILEAVYVCGTTKSHRMARDKEMIRFGCEESHLCMRMVRQDIPYRIDMHLKKNKSKGIAINGAPIRKAGDVLQLGSYIFFSPEDLGIIKNGPGERRRFMDMQLCQLQRLYLSSLTAYNRVLLQRSRLMKDMYFRSDIADTMDVWDEQLVRYGRPIIRDRDKFVRLLNEIAGPIHERLTGGREVLKIEYEQSVGEDEFEEKLRGGRERDLKMKITGCGPHRDDIRITANGTDLRRFGSQGQQRTAALAMKLSEIEMVRQITGDNPVLLLDDVLSELDENRQRYLLDNVQDVQTLLTCTGIENLTRNRFKIDRLYEVRQGQVACEDAD